TQTTTGLGAVIGAIVAGEFLGDRRRRIAIGASLAIIATVYAIISQSTQLFITASALLVFGFAYFVLSTVSHGLLIAGSPDQLRGRVMGLYTMMTAGGVPIAALIGGAIGSLVGPGEAVGVASIIVFLFLGWVLATHRLRLVRLDLHSEPVDDPALVQTV